MVEEPTNVEALAGLGRIEALQRRFPQAESLYQKALAQKPQDFTTLFYLAELRIDQKRYGEAQDILRGLIKRDANAVWVQQALDRAEIGPFLEQAAELKAKGDYQGAIAIYQQQLEKNPSPELYLGLANLYTETGNSLKAIQLLNTAKQRFPQDQSLNIGLGFTYLARNDLTTAACIFKKALESEQGRSEVLAGLGKIAALRGQTNRAQKLYQQSLELNPLNTLALSYLAALRLQQGNERQAQQLFENIYLLDPQATWAKQAAEEAQLAPVVKQAALEEKQGQFQKAQDLYEELVRQFPNMSESYIRLARFYSARKKSTKAIDTLLHGLRVNPDATPLYIALGHAYVSNGDIDQAFEALNASLKLQPSNPEALAEMGHLLAALGDEPSADNFYEWALSINPSNLTALSYLIDLKMAQKNYQQALQLSKKVLKINPNALWAKQALTRAKFGHQFDEIHTLEAAGQLSDAEERLRKLVADAPQNELAYLELGQVYTRLNRYGEAVRLYKQGLQNIPESNLLRVDLGLAYLNQHEPKKAKTLLRAAYNQDSQNSDARAALGKVALISGDKTAAENWYESALKQNPDNLLALSFLAELWMQEKKFDQAQSLYEKIVRLDPKAVWAQDAVMNAHFAPLLDEADQKEKQRQFAQAEDIYLELIEKAPRPRLLLQAGAALS